MTNLLAQNQELKRLKKEAERRRLEDEDEKALGDEEAQVRALEEFERVQAGFSAHPGSKLKRSQRGEIHEAASRGTKRRIESADDGASQLAKNGTVKRRLSESKSELASFWVPSETPDNQKAAPKDIKRQPTCPAADNDQPHDFSLKTLIAVWFHGDVANNESDAPARICPACDKVLSNTTKAVLGRPCGHVLCKPCSDKFQTAPEKSAHDTQYDETIRCYVCQEDVTPGRKLKPKGEAEKEKEKSNRVVRGLVELSCEGTGFAGGGRAEVKKAGVVFQC